MKVLSSLPINFKVKRRRGTKKIAHPLHYLALEVTMEDIMLRSLNTWLIMFLSFMKDLSIIFDHGDGERRVCVHVRERERERERERVSVYV